MRIGPMEAVSLVLLLVLLVAFVVVQRGRTRRTVDATLADIFGEVSSPRPGSRARLWALGVLHEAGVDSDSDPGYAAKVLRTAEPRLSSEAARALIDTLNRD